jgi:HSP20 family molecular chaperone IbpA
MAAQPHDVAPQEKREPAAARSGRLYSPDTDIYETKDAVIVAMEVPGVAKADIDIRLEKGRLTITANVDSNRDHGLEPIYSEYNVGNFARTFTLSTKIDSSGITANVADGVLTVRLPKAQEALARRIALQ